MPDTASVSEEVVQELVTEKSISDSWRISVKQLATMRRTKLRRKFHWDIDGYTVKYTHEGVERLKDLIQEGLKTGQVKEKEPVVVDDIAVDLALKKRWKVVRIPPNPRLVLVENQWSAETMYLFVRNHRNFKRNMIIQEDEISPPDATGRRRILRALPRSYGRW